MAKEFYRSLGLEVAGVKSHKSALAVLDYYPRSQRLVLLDVENRLQHENEEASSDELLLEAVSKAKKSAPALTGIGVHGPTSLPPYLKEPGKRYPIKAATTRDAEAKWMNELWDRLEQKPRPFVPYIQRPAEVWLRYMTSEKLQITDGFGSNGAPLAARLQFLLPHLPKPIHEVFPRGSVLRTVSNLGMGKWIGSSYTDLERGVKAREEFFNYLLKKVPQLFIYDRDLETMIAQIAAFNAFIAALTEFLIWKEECESPPRGFPKTATWIYLPRHSLDWGRLFR